MKKVITLLCACSLLSSISTTVFAENIITNSEKITDAKEIYDIVAPFIEENYADDAIIIYDKDEDYESVYVTIRQQPIGVTDSYAEGISKKIYEFIEEKNIDSDCFYVGIQCSEPVASENNDIAQAPNDAVALGDINADGTIDLTDLSKLSLYLIGDSNLTETQQKAADVNNDGEVRITDLATLRQYISKVIDSLG